MYGSIYGGPVYGFTAGLPPTAYFSSPLETTIRNMPVPQRPVYNSISYQHMQHPIYHDPSDLERYILTNRQDMMHRTYRDTELSYTVSYSGQTYAPLLNPVMHDPGIFLVPNRPKVPLVERISPQLKATVQKIFRFTTNEEIPQDILMSILSPDELKREHAKHSRTWSNGIQGFALNRRHLNDFSQIFVKQNLLDALLLTIGHEIGHCLTFPHPDPVMEEAKAFAFEMAWMQTIHRFDIMGLRPNMNVGALNPAQNGLHNVALAKVMERKAHPMDVFRSLADSCTEETLL